MEILDSLNLDMKFTCWHRLYFSCDHAVYPQIGQGATDQAARKRHVLYRQKRYTQQMYIKVNCQHEVVTLQHCQQNTEIK
jgi:hypothetical protein